MERQEHARLGQFIRQYRRAAQLTQEALAERAGVSVYTISNLERGVRHMPRMDTLQLLADALGLTDDTQRQALYEAAQAPALACEQRSADRSSIGMRGCGYLPMPPTPLVGRECEVAMLGALLQTREGRMARVRLVTLVGPPGVGKTRLALEVAHLLDRDSQDDVVFVSLAPLAEPQQVPLEIASSLGLEETDGTPAQLLARLVRHIGDRYVLLVLDNFEHILAAAPLVADLLARCAHLVVLVTSRVALNVRGEHDLLLHPLAVPAARNETSLDGLCQVASVQLLLQRAQAILPDFALTSANAAAVADICRRLDGLPLALELVAARLRLFPPQSLLARLEHRLTVLVNGPVDLPKRQQSLRAALTWSYDLLPEATRRVFRLLAVFADGGALSAIESVCQAIHVMGDVQERGISDGGGDVALCLAELAEHHLLVTGSAPSPSAPSQLPPQAPDDVDEHEPRIRMLHTFREYAAELLHATGEWETVARAHARYYADFAEEASHHWKGPMQGAWLRHLDREYNNLLAALRWSVRVMECEIGLRLVAALGPYWFVRGRFSEGREWLERWIAMSEPVSRRVTNAALRIMRIRALGQAAKLATRQGEYTRAAALLDEALSQARDHAEPKLLSILLNSRGIVASNQGQYHHARVTYLEALAISRQLNDKGAMSAHLGNLANIAYQLGDYATAANLCEETLPIDREVGDTRNVAASLANWGRALRAQGDFVEAERLFVESLALRRELEEPWGVGHVLVQLAELELAQGHYVRASAYVDESEFWLKQTGDRGEIANRLRCLGDITHGQGQLDQATRYYEESLAHYRVMKREPDIASLLLRLSAVARDQGNEGNALRLCREALHIYRRLGIDRAAAHCLEFAAALSRDRNRTLRAERLAALARAMRVRAASSDITIIHHVSATL